MGGSRERARLNSRGALGGPLQAQPGSLPVPGFYIRLAPIKLYSAFSNGSTCESVKKNVVIFIKLGFLSSSLFSGPVFVRFQISSFVMACSPCFTLSPFFFHAKNV